MKLAAIPVSAVALGVLGCGPRNFTSTGSIASEGDRINTWHTTFQGCTRDPFDGLSEAESRSILTFVWQDPGIRDARMDSNHNPPDYPMRFEFSRGPQGPVATLHTVRHAGIPLNPEVCTTFQFKTEEHSGTSPEQRPSLSGDLALECGEQYGHITTHLHFEGCKF